MGVDWVWERSLTEQDKAHLAASAPTRRRGFGRRPAVLSIDNYRKALGDKPEPILESIRTWPSSTGLAGWKAATEVAKLLSVARAAKIPVIHLTGLAEEESGIPAWGARLGGRHARSGRTPDEMDRHRRRFDFIEQAEPLPGEVVLRKTAPSGFCGTPLLGHLISEGIDTLIVCGESVSGCVRATVTDGCSNRLHMVVVEGCVYDRHEASRAINLFGEEILPGNRGIDADLLADLEMVVESLERGRRDIPYYGVGFGATASDAGAYPISTAQVRVETDGSVIVLSGSAEMGQGSRSLLAQITAEEFGIEMRKVSVVQSDTAGTAYERTTGASRTTTLTGLALQRACDDAKQKLRAMAAELWDCSPDQVTDAPGGVRGPDGQALDFGAVVRNWFGGSAGEVTGVGLLRRDGVTKEMPPFWETGMVGVAVEVDPDTEYVTVDQLVTCADVGFAINPQAVEGQDLGAATQGLGAALFEELVYDGPQLANANVVDYRVPRAGDLARRIDLMIAERRDGVGPYGAKGAGEGQLNPIGGAVASAVAQAIGRWPTRLPLTPERVWRLMNDLPEED